MNPTLTVDGYLGQHLAGHEAELTDQIRANAAETVRRINLVLERAARDGAKPTVDGTTHTYQASGWRPAGVNAATSNAAEHSTHLTGEAEDVRDDPVHRPLARWMLLNQHVLAQIGLWCERPQWCPSWVHFQTRPPGSGLRVYVPSKNPPLCPPLPGEL